ncbi:MAG TPA: dicarboxylate/amino acid:cation symporter [Bryobacteraceae bacterium]|nr:dicarboxylate/amino acid:cation symporter [Bryobacteraceae bacterium]
MTPTRKPPFYRSLHFQVLAGIIIGIALGVFYPKTAEAMKPLGDGFIKLIRMVIAPIIFCTVVVGIANVGDMKKLGRIGVKALVYFEIVSTLSLLIGLVVVTVFQPGAGINATAATLDVKSIAEYAAPNKAIHTVDFLLNIIPDTVANAFAKGEILQVLFLAVIFGLALANFEGGRMIVAACDTVAHAFFKVIEIIMKAAPIGTFGAMAFTIGRFGLKTLIPLAKLMACVYLTSILFVFVVLGLIARANGFSIWKLLTYLKEEFLIVLGTSSSEPALPGLMLKLERLGCAKSVVGLVVPSGYSFNLDGTSIYLTIAAVFVAQATNTQLTAGQLITLLLVLMLTSKGAAAVTGGGFITLAATLTSLGTVPVAGIALLLGVDRFMSQMRSLTNLAGNGVAAIVVARWEKEYDAERAQRVLNGEPVSDLAPELVEARGRDFSRVE